MTVLVACEESQVVTAAFRRLGHEAYSCDIELCSGGHPEWHLQQDVLPLLDGGWDMIIAFPPCTYLTVTGNRWFDVVRYGDKARQRHEDRKAAVDFFMKFTDCNCDRVAVENPVGIMSTLYRKPDQIIQPYQFGDAERKTTCLWLKGLTKLTPTNVVAPLLYTYKDGRTDGNWHMKTMKLPPKERAKVRSTTFSGIAAAMAQQWTKG